MKSNAEKLLDLAIQVEVFNQEFKSITDQISSHIIDCRMSKSSMEIVEPCLTEWLETKYETDYSNCPVSGREFKFQRLYWTAPSKTEEDCPHCFAALKLIEKRKELKQKRGRVKAQLTKIVKREIRERGAV